MEALNRFNKAEMRDWGIAALRIAVGIVLLAHGSQKLFVFGLPHVAAMFGHIGLPMPMVSAALSAAAEFLGGIALLLGLYTRPAAAVVTINMAVAVIAVHVKNGFFAPTGFEYPFTLLVANAMFVLTGPGAFALDNLLHGNAPLRHGPTPAPLRG